MTDPRVKAIQEYFQQLGPGLYEDQAEELLQWVSKAGSTILASDYLLDGSKLSEHPLQTRLRVVASLMHTGSAWGFCREGSWLEEAADLIDGGLPRPETDGPTEWIEP